MKRFALHSQWFLSLSLPISNCIPPQLVVIFVRYFLLPDSLSLVQNGLSAPFRTRRLTCKGI